MVSKRTVKGLIVAGIVTVFTAGYSFLAIPGNRSANAAADSAAPVTRSVQLPDFTRIVEQNGSAVVNVAVSRTASDSAKAPPGIPQEDPFFEFFRRYGPQNPKGDSDVQRGQGSGFIVSADGIVLTNAHVIADATEISVKLTDRREFAARVIGIDKRTDIAVLKIEATNLPIVDIGDPAALKVGEWVAAIGSPFGFENTVTSGIVSAKARSLPDANYVPFIQTDVAVNPGNSGGPLFNMNGEVVGINSQIFSRTGGYMGLSFAIPIDVAMQVRDELLAHGKVTRGRLGVRIQDVNQALAQSFGMDKPLGALISLVEPGSPADKAGLKSGDVILSVNGKEISRQSELPSAISAIKPGKIAALDIWRDGSRRSVEVQVGELNEKIAAVEEERRVDDAKLGLTLRPLSPEEKARLGAESGLVVERVTGPAAKAGIQAGDVILALNQEILRSVEQLKALVKKTDGTVALLIQRDDMRLFVPVQIG
ncbi:MAG: DegQ family serine endoprotease [Burkholderiales bacterium]